MSIASPSPDDYRTGRDRYVNFAKDFLGVKLGGTQKRFLRELATNQRVLIISGNGVGKSYVVAIAILAFLYTNPDSTVLGTSGSYSQFVDTMWRPLTGLHQELEDLGFEGEVYHGNQPRLEVDGPEWYAKVVSPRDSGDLEGRHASDVLVVIEEADKRYIGDKHFDSAGSSITDTNDRMIAVANPPEDENNIVYDLMRPESRWTVVQFSSFESHNALIDAGVIDDEPIPGLVDLPTIADDWEAWNDEPWPKAEEQWVDGDYPGVDALLGRVEQGQMSRDELLQVLRPGVDIAKRAHEHRDDLDIRWYRRRAGVIPPDSATAFRPFSVGDVEDAYKRDADETRVTPNGAGLDVARMGGDVNVLAGVYGDELRILDDWRGVDHTTNRNLVTSFTSDWVETPFAVDAQGEGSGLGDMLVEEYPDTIRFNSGEKACQDKDFYDKWAEGLYELGKFLREGGSINNHRLREELIIAARIVEFEEKHYATRDATVLKATSKDKIKEALGRSPDFLDAAMMAAWAASDAPEGYGHVQLLTW